MAAGATKTLIETRDAVDTVVEIVADSIQLEGRLFVPPSAGGIVIFANSSGSSRLSPRSNYMARVLHDAGLATLLFDLLTESDADDRARIFDLKLLVDRLRDATRFVRQHPQTRNLPLGYLGASTGAAAALIAAATDRTVGAVVSRGGRPDLVSSALPEVEAPTLLIVGGGDRVVAGLNEQAYERMVCRRQLVLIPGASHLFDEPGALEQVTDLANGWFVRHLMQGE